MPAPQENILRSIAILKFQSFQIQLPAMPDGGSNPGFIAPSLVSKANSPNPINKIALSAVQIKNSPQVRQTTNSSSNQQQTAQPMNIPPSLFKAASNNVRDVENQRVMHDIYMKLFNGIIKGIVQAWSEFNSSATLVAVDINGPIASGGVVWSPCLEVTVLNSSTEAGTGQWELRIREQIAKAFWTCWREMMQGIKVPFLPWYPAFLAVPGPAAPPTPNVPTPLITLMRNHHAMSTQNLKNTFSEFLHWGNMDYHTQFSEALAVAIDSSFQLWKGATFVRNVIGTGNVPTFAPPYVPVGPVVGGKGNMTPGGFS